MARAVLTAMLVCALVAAGCGDDDDETTGATSAETTTPSAGESPEQTVDAAVQSCREEAQQLGGAAGTALGNACTSVGNTAKQALSKTGIKA
jgi:hypothetical protein